MNLPSNLEKKYENVEYVILQHKKVVKHQP